MQPRLYLSNCLGLNKVDRRYYEIRGDAEARAAGYGDFADYQNKKAQAEERSRGPAAPDYAAIAREQLRLQQEANKPAIESLQASIPTTQASFAQREQQLSGQREPLKQRYQSILDELKRREGVQTQQVDTRTAQEFGRRGIPLSSTYYTDAGIQARQPISEYYTGQTRDVGLTQADAERELENLIAGVPIERQTALDKIQQAIAQLQAGGSSQAIQNALSLFQTQTQANQAAQAQALQERLALASQALQDKQFGLQEQQAPLQLALLQAQLDKSRGGGGTGTGGASLQSIFDSVFGG